MRQAASRNAPLPSAAAPRIAFLGDGRYRPTADLAHLGRPDRFDSVGEVLAAFAARSWRYEIAVVAQSRPGQFSPETVDRLLGGSPLTRWLVRFGPWCRSERRRDAGTWPAGIVFLDDEFDDALIAAIGACGLPALPHSARRDERELRRAA